MPGRWFSGDQKPSAMRRSCNRFSKRDVRSEFSRVNASRLQHSVFGMANFCTSTSKERPGDAQGLEEGELGSDGASGPSSLDARVESDAQLKAGDPGNFMALNLCGDNPASETLTPIFEAATSMIDKIGA